MNLPKELVPFEPQMTASAKSANVAKLESKATNLFESKIGGTPYYPKDKEYPTDKAGKPMRLLAQINFEKIPPIDNFPTCGLLQFFLTENDATGMHGLDLDNRSQQENFRVIYHEEIDTDLSHLITTSPASGSDSFPFDIDTSFALHFEMVNQVVSPHDFTFENYFGMDCFDFFEQFGAREEEVSDFYYDNFHPWKSQLGGYPAFTQEDPRFTEKWQDYDTLLFQMVSTGTIMWGDMGVGNFFIKKEDLINRNFSNILYNWDCY